MARSALIAMAGLLPLRPPLLSAVLPLWFACSLICACSEKLGPDTTPPRPVSDLTARALTKSSVVLTWTASGDDDMLGTALAYDIRYSVGSNPILC